MEYPYKPVGVQEMSVEDEIEEAAAEEMLKRLLNLYKESPLMRDWLNQKVTF